jgi:hypothetical protein
MLEKQTLLGINSLSKRRFQVIMLLAMTGPLNIYQIKQKLSLPSYSTAHKTVKDLEKEGLLRMQGVKKTAKGVYAKIYELTFLGLMFALTNEKILNNLDKVVEAWENAAPLPLREYPYFVKCGLKEEAVKFYQQATRHSIKELVELNQMLANLVGDEESVEETLTKKAENIVEKLKEIWSNKFLEEIIGPKTLESLIKWYRALRNDPEIRSWTIQTLRRKAIQYRTWANVTEKILKIIESKEEPEWIKIQKQEVSWPIETSWKFH